MKLFANVIAAYREWLMSFSFVRMIQPFAMYIVFISLGIDFVQELIYVLFNRTFGMINFLETLAYFGFFLGLALLFLSKDLKWAPYAIFVKVFIFLFPFTYFGLYTVIRSAIYLWLGVQLLRFTAVRSEDMLNGKDNI
jgi:hypothetical protein